jgi:glycosyltransferase involved in cell wall biosynthesis
MSVDISVVICTRDRSQTLAKTLDSLLGQVIDGPVLFSVIVVDNNSRDNTKSVVEGYVPRFNGRLRYGFEPEPGISSARNLGIQLAQGSIIVFTDDDCTVDRYWIRSIYHCFVQHDVDAVGGRILPIYPEGTPEWVDRNKDILCGPIVFHDHGSETMPYTKTMREFFGANIAFKRTVFEECGLFRMDLGAGRGVMGEDTEIFNRLIKNKKKIYYCGQAVVHHPVDLARTKLKYLGKWNIQIAKYRFIVDDGAQIDRTLVYCFGMPRYLIQKIILMVFALPFKIFNRREFLKAWIQLSQQWGRLTEIRKIYYAH